MSPGDNPAPAKIALQGHVPMYIDHIKIDNFRTFRKTKISFCHTDQDFEQLGMRKPRHPNLNLLLANNGLGKTSLLRAVALAALGPAVGRSGIYPYHLIRREVGDKQTKRAILQAGFTAHEQDDSPVEHIESRVEVMREGDLEHLEWTHADSKTWHPVI